MRNWSRILLSLLLATVLLGYGVAQEQSQDSNGQAEDAQTQEAETTQAEQTEESEFTFEGLRMALTNLAAELEEFQAMQDVAAEDLQLVNIEQFASVPAVSQEQEAVAEEEPEGEAQAEAEGAGNEQEEVAGGGQAASDTAAELSEIESLIGQDQEGLAELHTAIKGNPAIMQALQRQDVAVEDVVAMDVTESGKVVLFFRESVDDEQGAADEEQSVGAGQDAGAGGEDSEAATDEEADDADVADEGEEQPGEEADEDQDGGGGEDNQGEDNQGEAEDQEEN